MITTSEDKTPASDELVRRKHSDEVLKSKADAEGRGDLTKIHSSQQVLEARGRSQVVEGGIDFDKG